MAKHIHKYRKVSVNGVMVWACALPTCTHHMPKHYEHMMPGKATICWNCGKETLLDDNNMGMEFPICYECAVPESAGTVETAFGTSSILDEYLKKRELNNKE